MRSNVAEHLSSWEKAIRSKFGKRGLQNAVEEFGILGGIDFHNIEGELKHHPKVVIVSLFPAAPEGPDAVVVRTGVDLHIALPQGYVHRVHCCGGRGLQRCSFSVSALLSGIPQWKLLITARVVTMVHKISKLVVEMEAHVLQ